MPPQCKSAGYNKMPPLFDFTCKSLSKFQCKSHTLRTTKIKDFKVSSFICNPTAFGLWCLAEDARRASRHIRQLPQCWATRFSYYKLAHKFYIKLYGKFRYNGSPKTCVCVPFSRRKLGHYPGSG